jgi:hypothetical protein
MTAVAFVSRTAMVAQSPPSTLRSTRNEHSLRLASAHEIRISYGDSTTADARLGAAGSAVATSVTLTT